MQTMSPIRKDFVISHLRVQFNKMKTVLSNIEDDTRADFDYTNESLKDIEGNLRQIRKLCGEF